MSETSAQVIQGACHCGAVGFEITESPGWLTECNCSICRRIGARWGHINIAAFSRLGDGETRSYIQGDKKLAMQTCVQCGCTTHYETLDADHDTMAVNFRMCDPEIVARFRIRKFDGADSWEFLD